MRDKAKRNAWSRERTCAGCGTVEIVRKDNSSTLCKSCGGRHGRPRWKEQMPLLFGARKVGAREHRHCKTCGTHFQILKSTLRGSNASGNFCSRPCYYAWLKTPAARRPATGRNWSKIARQKKVETPYCAICGRLLARLEVHHILPQRKGGGDEDDNLIVLCVEHHKMVEVVTRSLFGKVQETPHQLLAALALMLRFRQAQTVQVLRSIAERRL